MKTIATALFLAAATAFLPSSLVAQIYSSCDQWGNVTTNGYNIYNNIWGSGAGSQCLTVNAYNSWYVDANHPNTSGIKSYPNVERQLSLNVDSMGAVSSTFAVSRPSGGAYSSTYDIWYNNYAYEVMLWMNKTGAVGPIASAWDASGNPIAEFTNVSVGGHTWNIYRGSNGANAVFSFVRTSNTDSGTIDITAISQWLRNNGWFGNVNLHSIQFGFEITASNGAQRYSVTNFGVTTGTATTTLTVSPASLSYAAAASSQSITIASNTSWTVTDNQTWITPGTTSGSNNGSSSIAVTANTGTASRTGTVTVTGGGLTRTVAITQSGTTGGGSFPAAGTYSLRSRTSGRMLDNLGVSSNGANVGQWDDGSSTNQRWVLSYISSSVVKLQCVTGSRFLDGIGRTAAGSNVGQWASGTSNNQRWTIIDVGGGYFKLKNVTTGLCLDVGASPWPNGDLVQQFADGTSQNQHWQFVAP